MLSGVFTTAIMTPGERIKCLLQVYIFILIDFIAFFRHCFFSLDVAYAETSHLYQSL